MLKKKSSIKCNYINSHFLIPCFQIWHGCSHDTVEHLADTNRQSTLVPEVWLNSCTLRGAPKSPIPILRLANEWVRLNDVVWKYRQQNKKYLNPAITPTYKCRNVVQALRIQARCHPSSLGLWNYFATCHFQFSIETRSQGSKVTCPRYCWSNCAPRTFGSKWKSSHGLPNITPGKCPQNITWWRCSTQ